MLLVVVPVIFMSIYFSWIYRENNKTYDPKWTNSKFVDTIIWTIPCIIVSILSVIAWRSSHILDPYRSIESEFKPININVVSFNWKWLFIYPDYNIATINEIVFPINVPIRFRITSATVMNSFFIPQLGSQIYSMNGMETNLDLISRKPGIYSGISANYSGNGFSDMQFKAIATSMKKFNEWIDIVHKSNHPLDQYEYSLILNQSINNKTKFYSYVPNKLFDRILSNKKILIQQ